jgi:hypothetical protein
LKFWEWQGWNEARKETVDGKIGDERSNKPLNPLPNPLLNKIKIISMRSHLFYRKN